MTGSVNSKIMDTDKFLDEFPKLVRYIKKVTGGDVHISKPRVKDMGPLGGLEGVESEIRYVKEEVEIPLGALTLVYQRGELIEKIYEGDLLGRDLNDETYKEIKKRNKLPQLVATIRGGRIDKWKTPFP